MDAQAYVMDFAEQADIRINGSRPWDVTVYNQNLYKRILTQGTLGLGEAYMEGWWDCPAIDQMISRALGVELDKQVGKNLKTVIHKLMITFLNLQSQTRSQEVARRHYNIDHALFEAMLDPYMQYSCGYWKDAHTLEKAQLDKMELICQKLHLCSGMTVLDIGCGWGGLGRYMARRYGVRVTGITISTEQMRYAREWSQHMDVEIRNEDYRNLEGQWDRVVSVGMFEHVGCHNYTTFFDIARQCLKPDGLFLLHTIGGNGGIDSGSDPWLERYIFPNGVLPTALQITKTMKDMFIIEDWHNFGAYYDATLMAWYARLSKAWAEERIVCSETMRRMFTYYLLSCAGVARTRNMQLWQLVLSPAGVKGGYESVR